MSKRSLCCAVRCSRAAAPAPPPIHIYICSSSQLPRPHCNSPISPRCWGAQDDGDGYCKAAKQVWYCGVVGSLSVVLSPVPSLPFKKKHGDSTHVTHLLGPQAPEENHFPDDTWLITTTVTRRSLFESSMLCPLPRKCPMGYTYAPSHENAPWGTRLDITSRTIRDMTMDCAAWTECMSHHITTQP